MFGDLARPTRTMLIALMAISFSVDGHMTITSRLLTWVSAVCAPVRGVSTPVISRGKDGVRRENLDLRFAWDA
jgi:hypothetical protein